MSSLLDKSPATSLLRRQLILLAALFLALLLIGWTAAYSALLGGLIVIISNAYLAHKVFRPYRAQQPEKLLGAYYRAMIGKMLITISLFTVVFVLITPLNIVSLVLTYLLIQIVPSVTNF